MTCHEHPSPSNKITVRAAEFQPTLPLTTSDSVFWYVRPLRSREQWVVVAITVAQIAWHVLPQAGDTNNQVTTWYDRNIHITYRWCYKKPCNQHSKKWKPPHQICTNNPRIDAHTVYITTRIHAHISTSQELICIYLQAKNLCTYTYKSRIYV